MTKTAKIVLVVMAAAIVGAYFFPKVKNLAQASNAAGTTFSTAKVAEITWTPSTAAASTTSVYNSDAKDRVVDSSFVDCSGTGTSHVFPDTGGALTSWIVSAATTSVANEGTQGNVNYVLDAGTNAISTSTPFVYSASSTPGRSGVTGGNFVRIWPTGTYMTFLANATNTAVCEVGVYYHSR